MFRNLLALAPKKTVASSTKAVKKVGSSKATAAVASAAAKKKGKSPARARSPAKKAKSPAPKKKRPTSPAKPAPKKVRSPSPVKKAAASSAVSKKTNSIQAKNTAIAADVVEQWAKSYDFFDIVDTANATQTEAAPSVHISANDADLFETPIFAAEPEIEAVPFTADIEATVDAADSGLDVAPADADSEKTFTAALTLAEEVNATVAENLFAAPIANDAPVAASEPKAEVEAAAPAVQSERSLESQDF